MLRFSFPAVGTLQLITLCSMPFKCAVLTSKLTSGHNTCSECFARITDPSQAIANGNAEGRMQAKCPNCRGEIVTNRVIDSNAFKYIHMPEKVTNGQLEDDDSQAGVDTTDDNDSENDDEEDEEMDSKGNLKGFIVNEDDIDSGSSESEDEYGGPYRSGKTPFEKSVKKKTKKLSKGKGKAKEPRVPKQTLAQLKKESLRNVKARKRYLKRLEKDWIPSAKIEKTIELLRAIQQRKEPEKTIIFSQFTSLLDLLEVPIARERWDYRRYDGSVSRAFYVIEKSDWLISSVSRTCTNSPLHR